MSSRSQKAILEGLLPAFAITQVALGYRKEKFTASAQMNESQRAVHALNRLIFGPRPGEVNRVMAMGVDEWIAEQLHPDKIDDSGLNARLPPHRTLRIDTQQI